MSKQQLLVTQQNNAQKQVDSFVLCGKYCIHKQTFPKRILTCNLFLQEMEITARIFNAIEQFFLNPIKFHREILYNIMARSIQPKIL